MKKVIIIFLIVLAIAFLIARGNNLSKKIKTVNVEVALPGEVSATILSSGKLSFSTKVKISSEVISKVKKIYVKEGDNTKVGQLLFELDDSSLKAEVKQQNQNINIAKNNILQAKRKIKNLKSKYDRYSKIYPKGIVSKDTYEQVTLDYGLAKGNYQSTKFELQRLQSSLEETITQLEKTKIYSPLNGIILELSIKESEIVVPSSVGVSGSVLAVIADPRTISADILLDEADIGLIEKGQKGILNFLSYPTEDFSAEVVNISLVAKKRSDDSYKTFLVQMKLDEVGQHPLFDGMSFRSVIRTASAKGVIIPMSSILTKDENTYVFLIEDDIAIMKNITIGMSDDENAIVSEGVDENDIVITGPSRLLNALEDNEAVLIDSK